MQVSAEKALLATCRWALVGSREVTLANVYDIASASSPVRDSMAAVFQDLKADGEKLKAVTMVKATVGPGELLWIPAGPSC